MEQHKTNWLGGHLKDTMYKQKKKKKKHIWKNNSVHDGSAQQLA